MLCDNEIKSFLYKISKLFLKSNLYSVVFLGSAPGYHTSDAKEKWGHMKVRKYLRNSPSWKQSNLPIIAQCSSIG